MRIKKPKTRVEAYAYAYSRPRSAKRGRDATRRCRDRVLTREGHLREITVNKNVARICTKSLNATKICENDNLPGILTGSVWNHYILTTSVTWTILLFVQCYDCTVFEGIKII
jgi:hypothetical protein